MLRYLLIAALLVVLPANLPAQAQPAAAVVAGAAADKPAAPSPPAADPAQARELIKTLNDPAARQKLIDQLTLLTQQQAQKQDEADPIGTRILKFLSAEVAQAGEEFGALGHSFHGLPAAGRWFERQMADPERRAHWVDLAGSLATVLAGGASAFGLALLAIRGPRRSLERHRPTGAVSKLLLGILRLALRLIPIGLFGVAGYTLLSMDGPPAVVSLATLTIINATMLVLGVIAISRFLLAPRTPALRLVPFGDRAARFLHGWISWIGAIVAFGCFGISALVVLGMPRVAAHAAVKLLGLGILIILVSLVISDRKEVARWIRGRDADHPKGPAPFFSLRQRVAEVWHLLAIAYLVATFAVFAFDIKGGFDFILHATLVSVGVIAAARVGILLVEHAVTRGTRLTHGSADRFPRLRDRADIYLPILRAGASAIVWLVAVVALFDIWGFDAVGWITGPDGRAVLGRVFSIAFIVVSALVAWEFVSAVIETYLVGAVGDGTPIQRSQRVRTLLPLLRNAFLIFLIVVVVLIVLSEIGLNIAPLLAGAGVVGLAIGFGAQTLVKDVITGVFILFENTIAVGDVVDLGGGHSGLVEHFSIRTIKLRDSTGGVHTVPFSAVTSVNNMTKDFAYYMFNIRVDYAIDSDKVVEAVTALGAELQEDGAYKSLILAPIEIIGLDSFGPDAAILQARFKTQPIKQWTVGREFNRRLKKRFAELGIPLSFPQNMVVSPGGGWVAPVESAGPEVPEGESLWLSRGQEPK